MDWAHYRIVIHVHIRLHYHKDAHPYQPVRIREGIVTSNRAVDACICQENPPILYSVVSLASLAPIAPSALVYHCDIAPAHTILQCATIACRLQARLPSGTCDDIYIVVKTYARSSNVSTYQNISEVDDAFTAHPHISIFWLGENKLVVMTMGRHSDECFPFTFGRSHESPLYRAATNHHADEVGRLLTQGAALRDGEETSGILHHKNPHVIYQFLLHDETFQAACGMYQRGAPNMRLHNFGNDLTLTRHRKMDITAANVMSWMLMSGRSSDSRRSVQLRCQMCTAIYRIYYQIRLRTPETESHVERTRRERKEVLMRNH